MVSQKKNAIAQLKPKVKVEVQVEEGATLDASEEIAAKDVQVDETTKEKPLKGLTKEEPEERNYKASLVLGKTVAHARRVEAFSETLYKALEKILELPKSSHKILVTAARLHDIGWIYGQSKHHKKSAQIIYNYAKTKAFKPEDSSIDSYLQKEVESLLAKNLNKVDKETARMIACVARYHRKSVPLNSHSMYKKLSEKNKFIVQKLSAILRIADALDFSHLALVKNLKVNIDESLVTLTLECNSSCNSEKQRVDVKKQPLQDILKKVVDCKIVVKTKD